MDPPPLPPPPLPDLPLDDRPSFDEALEASYDFLNAMNTVRQRTDNASGDALITNVDGSILPTRDEMSRSLIFHALSLNLEDPTLQTTVASDISSTLFWDMMMEPSRLSELYRQAREIIHLSASGVRGGEESSGMSRERKFRMSLEVQKHSDWLMSMFINDGRTATARHLIGKRDEAASLTLTLATTLMIILKRVYSS